MTRIQTAFAIGLGLGLLLGVATLIAAEQQRAGLVIQFGDGRVVTACVSLGADGQATGQEVLESAGLPLALEYSAVGAAVCQIDGEGCAYPGEPCFCQCTLRPGEPCRYWTYSRLVEGRWQYSQLGAANVTVRPGDVEGWAWGEGESGGGAQPPLRTFEEVCAPATETQTPAPSITLTPASPTSAPTSAPPTSAPPAPATADLPTPRATSLATAAALVASPTLVVYPSATLKPTAVAVAPTAGSTPRSETPLDATTVTVTLAAARPAGAATARAAEQYAPLVFGGAALPSLTATVGSAPPAATAPPPAATAPPPAATAPPPPTLDRTTPTPPTPHGSGPRDPAPGYGAFVTLTVLLVGLWAWFRWRR